jgi:two-component system response regulator RegA
MVEDDDALRSAVGRALRSTGRTVEEASTCADGLAALVRGFDLLLLDVRLPDGSGVGVAKAAAAMRPAPLIVVLSGEASAQEAFELARLGAVQFMSKPFSFDELLAAIDLVNVARVQLAPIVRSYVGQADLRDVQDNVRRAMVEQALALANGNRSVAARLLRVTRQAIQKFIRTSGE